MNFSQLRDLLVVISIKKGRRGVFKITRSEVERRKKNKKVIKERRKKLKINLLKEKRVIWIIKGMK